MYDKLIATLAFLCSSLSATWFCETKLAPEPIALAAPSVSLPSKDELILNLERDARAYVTTRARRRAQPKPRRPAALRLRRDLRALARLPLSRDERRDVCAHDALAQVRTAIEAEPSARLLKIFLTRACPSGPNDKFVTRLFSRYALQTGRAFAHPRPKNAYARAQAREWLRFVIARGDLNANDWRAVLAYAPDAADKDRVQPALWPAALADAVDGDWAKIGLNDTDVLAFAQKALGDVRGRARRRRLKFIARAFHLTEPQTHALKIARTEPPTRE